MTRATGAVAETVTADDRRRSRTSLLLRHWTLPLLTAGFVVSGLFKAIPALEALPVDLTVALAALTALGVTARLVLTPVPRAAHGVVAGFAILAPAAFFMVYTDYSVDKLVRLFTLTLLATLAAVVLIRSTEDLARHLWALTGLCGIVVLNALADPQLSSAYEGAPVTAQGVDTIELGVAGGVVAIVMALGVIWKRVPWLLALPVGGAALYVMLQSGSRGPLISALAAVALTIVSARRRPSSARSLSVLTLAVLGGFLAFSAAPYYAQLRLAGFLAGDVDGSVGGRIQLYQVAIDSLVRHPFGIGIGGFERIAFSGYAYPHNLPLEILTESGLVLGAGFLLWILLQVRKAHFATTDFTGAASLALLLFLLGKAGVSGDINDNRLLFYAIGIGIAAHATHQAAQPGRQQGAARTDATPA
jgi:O-Antigen ligase